MPISFDLPSDVEQQLAASFDDLGRAAKEALAIEGYREGKFGIATVRRIVGLETRCEAEQWLAQHNVPLNYTLEDLATDRQTLKWVLGDRE